MGFFNFIKEAVTGRRTKRYARMLNGNIPVYSQFGNDIYMSDVVEQAISCIVTEMMKLEPVHTIGSGESLTRSDGLIQQVLDDPNWYMTTSDLLQRIGYQLFANYNCFVVPVYRTARNSSGEDIRYLTELYPIQPTSVTFLVDDNGTRAIQFGFLSGYECIVNQDDIIHMKWHYHSNEFMGGDEQGQPNNRALMRTVKLNDVLSQSIAGAIESSFKINGVMKYKTILEQEKMDEAIEELTRQLRNNESGIVGVDAKADLIQFKKDIKLVDADTLKFIDQKILRHFGVSLAILTGDYTKTQYEAFYQKALEPIVNMMGQAFTKGLFTSNQRHRKNKIKFYTNTVEFMTMSERLELTNLFGASGTLFENEKRELFGYAPDKDLIGVRKQSLNYINTDVAETYQLNMSKARPVNTNVSNSQEDEGGQNNASEAQPKGDGSGTIAVDE